MSRSLFSVRALAGLIRAGDSQQFSIDLTINRDAIITAASASAVAGSIDLGMFSRTPVRGKTCVSYSSYHTHLVLRAISRHLRQRYRITVPNRDQIVRGVLETLMDHTPMVVIRRDIKSFYETIPIVHLKDEMIFNTASSSLVRTYLRSYFDHHCALAEHGLPRGIGLSALLAEIAMRDFDTKIRSIPGVFRYFRFSDDILIFSLRPAQEISDEVERALPDGMEFNARKSASCVYPGKKEKDYLDNSIEYLGYRFTTTQSSGREESREVRISISSRKANRIKTRIILSLDAHRRRPNWSLLRDRLHFLAANYSVMRQGIESLKGRTHVLSGIFYNYRLCGTYLIKNGKMKFRPYDCNELKALDGFFHSAARKHFHAIGHSLTPDQSAALKKISFNKGFELKIKARFGGDRVATIKRAWRNA